MQDLEYKKILIDKIFELIKVKNKNYTIINCKKITKQELEILIDNMK